MKAKDKQQKNGQNKNVLHNYTLLELLDCDMILHKAILMKALQPGIFAALLVLFAESEENDAYTPNPFLVMATFLFLFTFVGSY